MLVSVSTQTLRNRPKQFDINSEEHDKELQDWCRLHWQMTICKGVNSCNTPTYHDCCISFSRRGCVKKDSHPSIQSASILKIPSLKIADSHEALYIWLKNRLKIHHNMGQKTFFPSINSAHFNEEDDEFNDPFEKAEVLSKRIVDMAQELEKTRAESMKIKEENKRLLHSSKTWFDRYQELLYKNKDEVASYAETTPIKPFKMSPVSHIINFT